MLFILLVALSALFVAGCAAFFSIKGLIVLFSGSALAVGIMASSLEIGKLVAASFLHTYWSTMGKLLRLYLCLAVFVLMCITSLGIFGFLSGAYQVHSSATATVEAEVEALLHEKSAIDQGVLEQSDRIKTLTEIRVTQEERVKSAGNYKAPRDAAYKAIAEANEEIAKKEEALAKYRERTISIDQEISSLRISLNSNTDIGSFKFIAGALNTSVDSAVKYFIFTLIAVFDPLAVALVLCWNKLIEMRKKKQEEKEAFIESLLAETSPTAPLQEDLKKKTELEIAPSIEEESIEVQSSESATIAQEAPKKTKLVKENIASLALVDPSLSEEEQKAERARINKILGKHDSVIANS
jgi:hypothetical protein